MIFNEGMSYENKYIDKKIVAMEESEFMALYKLKITVNKKEIFDSMIDILPQLG